MSQLADSRELPGDEDPALADLVEELTTRLQAGGLLDSDALAREHPAHAEQLRELLPALQALAGAGAKSQISIHTAQTNLDVQTPISRRDGELGPGCDLKVEAWDFEPRELGDFRILREVGRGGMGVVYEAVQLSLGRRVALKVLPFACALHPRQVQRFKNEAHAAAGLHHSNIVPVHAVGCERGVHFYAMQFIDGLTLATVIQEVRQSRGARSEDESPQTKEDVGSLTPRPTPNALTTRPLAALRTEFTRQGTTYCRSVAALMVAAAEALEYAHQVGVVHRDIKPANLMLDARGHLWVTDFGLACCQGDPGLTGTNEQPGTLRYMSPEQALGPRAVVDHRTDVWGLGVTLYELLTLEPACPVSSHQELLARIASEATVPAPRRLNACVPVELETIVLKAVARNADERYATAAELADDLRRFLEDRPIRARRPALLERGRRWLRRHRAVAWAAAAVVVVAVAALATSTVLIAQQRDEARAQKQQAEQVVNKMYTDFAEKWLAQEPHLESRQREYLELALAFYERQMQQHGRDPDLRLAMGQAARRVGDIRHKLGDHDRAEQAYSRALDILRRLAADRPGRVDARAEVAVTLNHRGNLLWQRSRLEEAREAYRQARALFAVLVEQEPDEPAHRHGLAGSNDNLGWVAHNLLRVDEAEGAYRQALNLLRSLAAEHPQQPAYRHDLARTYNNLGYLLHDLGRSAEAEKAYRAALVLWKKLTREVPGARVYQHDEATCLHNLGSLRAAWGHPREAEHAYREALARRIRLEENFPQVLGYRQEHAATCHALGLLLASLGRLGEAGPYQKQALVLRKELAKTFPHVLPFQRDLAESLHASGALLAATGRLKEAQRDYHEALELRTQLARGDAPLPYRCDLAVTRHCLGLVLAEAGKNAEAEKLYRQALAALEEQPPGPALPALTTERASLRSDLGRLLHSTGRTVAAAAEYRRAVALVKQAADPRSTEVLAEALDRLGALLHGAGRAEEAEEMFKTSLEHRTRLEKDHPDVAAFQGGLAWFLATCPDVRFRDAVRAVECAARARDLAPHNGQHWARLGVAHYRAGDWPKAARALARAIELRGGGDLGDYFFLAMSRWRLGDKAEALHCYDRALTRLRKETPADDQLRRFQSEAAALIPSAPAGGPSPSVDH
jgi:serine/threonine protein kinase/Flp pilus assembly protein TadD